MRLLLMILPLFALAHGQGTLLGLETMVEPLYELYDNATIKAALDELANVKSYPESYNVCDNEEFDFIVVGSGSAGNVVANRLSEVGKWKVLLMEAGGYPIKSTEVPALAASYVNTEIDWAYRTEQDGESCLGMEGKQCSWPRGKVIGGSSNFNYMLYVRGNKKDFDRWEDEGCTGWGYKSVLPYFKKSEDMRDKDVLAFSPQYHSTGGYLKVERYQDFDSKSLFEGFEKGMEELGYQNTPDLNGANQTVYAVTQGTLEDGRRCSTAKGFLRPVKNRKNFKLSTYSQVTNVLIDENKRAVGVEFINKNGEKLTARAKKEIILSAGTIGSAQLLMVSGVGPKEHLEEFDIKVHADLPVGKNLQDHPLLSGLILYTNHSDIPVSDEESLYNFLVKKPSKYSNIRSVSYTGYVPTTEESDPDWPDCQLIMLSFPPNYTAGMDGWLTNTVGLRRDIQQQIRDLNTQYDLTYPFCSFLRPNGRGRILLKSADPEIHPRLITGYFSDESDFKKMLGFYDFVEKLVNTQGLKSIDAKIHEIEVPECSQHEIGSKDYRLCSLRHLTSTTFHHSGSCKMGPENDEKTVVDPRLRVKGVKGLRVCDASIMPHVVSGNTNAATIMIGEKCPDMIKEDWSEQDQGLLTKIIRKLLQ